MTDLTAPALAPRRIHPLSIVASVLYLAFAVITIIQMVIRGTLQYYFEYWANIGGAFDFNYFFGLLDLHYLLLIPVVLIGAVAATVLGVVSKKAIWQPLIGASIFVLFYALSWILQGIAIALGNWSDFFFPGYARDFLAWLTTGLLLIAILFSGLVWLTSKNSKSPLNPISVPNGVVTPPAAPLTPVNTSGSYTNLPMFALIGAFVVPLAGIILGHLSLSYMKKGQLSEQNKGMAKAGLILGYVFVGLGFLTGLILVIVLIVSAASGF